MMCFGVAQYQNGVADAMIEACDHISSALGKSPFWNGSAALAGSTRRSASADREAPEATMNARREIAIVSSHALLLSTAPNDPLSWATLSPSDQIVVRRSQPHRRIWKERRWRIIVNASDATTRIGQLLTSFDRRPQVSFRCSSSQPIIIRLKASGWSTLQKWLAFGISS